MNKINIYKFIFFLFISMTHAQKETNLFQKLNLEDASLVKVKESYKQGNTKESLKELLKVYRGKEDLYLRVGKQDKNYIKNEYPKEVALSIATANEVREKYFLFRYEWDMEKTNIPYQFKGEIDWLKIPGEDPEWVWMLNRHRFWVDLGKAYFLTENEKYAKTFVDQISHWIDENPINEKTKFKVWRRIETGIRCENWIKTFELIKKSKHVTPEFLAKFLNSLYQHGTYINESFGPFSQTSNWGVLEYQGVFHLSIFLKEFKDSSIWQKGAIEKLTACSRLQVLSDGTHWEESPMYHNEVLHSFLNVNLLAQRNNIELPEILVQKTKDMAYANIAWQKPNYHQPTLSDSDDSDLRGLLTLTASTFKDPVLKSRAFDKADYESYFILGEQGNISYKNIEIKQPAFLTKYQKSSGGFYMRTSWEEDATYASLMLKKWGSGHGHDNLLHFSLFANKRDYLVSSGRFTYVNNEWRKFFKMSDAQNTLGVDGLQNSIYRDTWSNSYQAWGKGDFTFSTSTFDYGEGSQTGYERLDDPVETKRRMLFLKPDVWLLFDSFSAKEAHTYSAFFNFPNDHVAVTDKGISTTYDKDNLRIQPLNNAEVKLADSWYSPEYNLKLKSKRAEIFKKQTGFTSLISLLYFPEKTHLKFEKVPVYTIKGVLFTDKDAEAVRITLDKKEYIFMVAYNSPQINNHFFKLDDQIVRGEIILIEKENGKTKTHIIKE